jgi:ATP-dependent RNA helicase DeaD
MNKFEELGLSLDVSSVLEREGIDTPTEIQSKAIPLVMSGKDVIGGSVTGSGKTLAFASVIVEKLIPNNHVQALILTPTRELAEQVSNSIKMFSRKKKLNVLSVYGGVDIEPQMRKLSKADVVVGTPGRILDHMSRRTLNLRNVKFLVLDEVDRMFDMGFRDDVEKILRECPRDRQSMLFSATISSDLDYLAKKYTNNPTEVSVKSYLDPSKLKQIYYDVPDSIKFSLLVHLLKHESAELVMVFCSTRQNVDFVVDNLVKNGVRAKAIHGGLSQNKRSRVLGDFHEGDVSVLVCTDVAARGLDIKGVSHVYNYDLPKTSDEYIHRIGRTARAGENGIAINILASRDYENFGKITQDENLNIKRVELPQVERVRINTNIGRRVGNKRFNDRDSRGSSGPNRRRPNSRRGSFGRDSQRSRGPRRGGRPSQKNSRRG